MNFKNWFNFKAAKFCLVILLVVLSFPATAQYTQADSDSDDCSMTLTITATPKTVKGWDNPVNIEVILASGYTVGKYCNTVETANITLFWDTGTGSVPLREGIVLELPANTNNKGAERSATYSESPVFANGGAKDNKTVVVTGHAVISSQSNFVGRPAVIKGCNASTTSCTANSVTITKDPKTTVPQNPPGGDPNTTSNTNAEPPNNSKNNKDINTSITATFNGSLDDNLGTFFNPLQVKSVPEIIASIIRILFLLISIAAVIIIIVSGFRMVLASGNEEQLTKAKKAITWAIVGLIVSLMSFSIVAIIQNLISRQ